MYLVCLATLVVVTSGYQQANSQSPGYQQANSQSPGYQQANSQSPGYQQANSQSLGYQQANSQSPGYQQANSQSLRYQQANSQNLGYQQANSQSSVYQQANNQRNQQINPTENIYQQQLNQRRIQYPSNNQRQNLGERHQNHVNNQQIQSSNHCQMVNTNFQCTSGPGRRIHNSGIVWDPSQEQDAGVDETFNCTPCCQFPGKTIVQCNSNIRLNQGRRYEKQIDTRQAQPSNHCQMVNTNFQCTSGPGQRIHNSGNVWDPSQEQNAGVDRFWNCQACCQYPGKTIPLCDRRMGQIMSISERNLREDCQKAETKGSDYDGNVNTTPSGRTCQNWSSQFPYTHRFGMLGNHNFCRNPTQGRGVWCYTTDPNKIYEYCNVPICG